MTDFLEFVGLMALGVLFVLGIVFALEDIDDVDEYVIQKGSPIVISGVVYRCQEEKSK